MGLGGPLQGRLYFYQNSVKETATRGSTHLRLVVRSHNVYGSPTNFTPQKDAGFVFVSEAKIGYHSPKYKMSIKFFPDYKHLLQENFVEEKHIFYLT
jgi:hypothetical protein